ncbi:MAG: DNA-processing protein DprA [Oscillospiraceae bacterium]
MLGCGPDIAYPAENARLYADILSSGVVLSEYPPGTEARSWHFPVRNRIISGLSVATLVVEAPEKSGALITAATALGSGTGGVCRPGPSAPGRSGL